MFNKSVKFFSQEEKAAQEIQAFIRGTAVRKKYIVMPLSSSRLTPYPVFVEGNDPEIDESKLLKHKNNDDVVLIGTSGLRIVEIACFLRVRLPKIIIIDNSKKVTQFWYDLQEIISKASGSKELEHLLSIYYEKHPDISVAGKDFEEDWDYIDYLISEFGFNHIKSIIMHASIFPQSWGDTETLLKIKNMIQYQQYDAVYAYVSNIIPYLNYYGCGNEAAKVMSNLALLKADLNICSNLDVVKQMPTSNIYFRSETNPSF